MVSKAMSWEEIQRIWDPIEEGKILKIFNDMLQFRAVENRNMCLDTNLNKFIIRVNFFVVL